MICFARAWKIVGFFAQVLDATPITAQKRKGDCPNVWLGVAVLSRIGRKWAYCLL
jgi:hypothetical protein